MSALLGGHRRPPGGVFGPIAHPALQRLTAEEKAQDLASERYAGDARLQAAFDNSPTLKFGERGGAVALVQQGLAGDGFSLDRSTKPDGSFDGIFGNETLTAVRGFQSKHGLTDKNGFADGIVGHDTMGKLDALAKGGGGGGGGGKKPAPACADAAVSEEPDPIPEVPPPSVKPVPGDEMLAEVRKRLGGKPLPKNPPLGATAGKVTQIMPITTRTSPDPFGSCVKCIAEWPLPVITIEILIAVGTLTNEKRFWATQQDFRVDCPTPVPTLKDVRVLIKPEALPKILVAEFEHALDIRRAFQLAMHRWRANVGRLSETRTHLRGQDDGDCRKKVEAFLNEQSELPLVVPLEGMPLGLFMDDFESLRAGSATRDEEAHLARANPPRERAPVPPTFDLDRNPFGCAAFFRKYDSNTLPSVPGDPPEIVVNERDGPPRRRWHSM